MLFGPNMRFSSIIAIPQLISPRTRPHKNHTQYKDSDLSAKQNKLKKKTKILKDVYPKPYPAMIGQKIKKIIMGISANNSKFNFTGYAG